MRFHSQVIFFRALVSAACCLLRWTLRGANCFRVALGVRLCAIPVVGLASLSALASLALAAVLLSIPVDYARAHSSGTATHHIDPNPLHAAATFDDAASINHFIVEHGLDVNTPAGILKWTPLHWAAIGGHLSAVATLLASGADVTVKTLGGYTPLQLAAQNNRAAVYPALIAAGAYWGDAACGSGLVTNPAGSAPPCVAAAACAAPSVRNAGTNLCDCPSPNVGTDGAAGPGDCAAPTPSVESCGGYVPAKFYDSAAGECAAFAACAAPAVRNAGTNLCDCPTPNVGTDGAAGPGDCAAPTPSADSCGRYVPAKFYDSAAGECAAFAACLAPAVLNAGANLCDCPAPNIGTDGAAEPGDCVVPAPSADSCGGLIPAQFYDAAANACVPFVECASSEVLHADVNDCHVASDDFLGDAVRAGDLDLVNHFITVHMADVNRANASGVTPLHWAAIGGHAAIAATLLAAGASVDAKDEDDETPLRWAAGADYVTVVVLLLAAGADVDAKNEDDETPLHFAARNGRASVVATLLARGADVNAKDEDDNTPLHFAAENGSASVVAALLAAEGVSVNVENDNDETPLHLAVGGGHAVVAAALIAGGAHWGDAACESGEATNPAGATPPCVCEPPTVGTSGNCVAPSKESCEEELDPAQFYDAAAGACVLFVECAPPEVLYAEANDCHAASAHPLHAAVLAGDLDLVNHFITVHMADVNARDGDETPLHYAANGGHAAIASVLIAAGADVNAKNDEDETPLRWAAGADYVTVVVLLLAGGADVDGKNDDDETPLHWAARNGRVAAVGALIAGGADVDAKDKDDDTPLHFAARNDRAVIVSLLIQATASLNIKNEDDDTPLHLAVEGGYAAVVAMLIAGGAYWGEAACGIGVTNPAGPAPPCVCESNVGTPGNCIAASAEVCGGLTPAQFYDAAAGACVPFVECVSPEVLHADVNDCHAHAPSAHPLHRAVLAGDLDLVNHFIMVHMADVDEYWGIYTPLHLAARYGPASIAAALIAAGADVEADSIGVTPLIFAMGTRHVTVVALLLAAGADVNAKNDDGDTPLHYAADVGDAAIIATLLAAEGVSVNAKNDDDDTPLHFAVKFGHASVVAALLAAGAEVNAKNKDDETPLHFAVEGGDASIAATLIAAGAYWGEAACESGDATNPAGATPPCVCEPPTVGTAGNCVAPSKESCEEELDPDQFYDAEAGACVPFVECAPPEVLYPEGNDCHAESDYPLHDAVFAGDLDLVNHFITFHMTEADVNVARGNGRMTPLHLAARDGHAAIAAALIAATANVNATNREGAAPLHLAASRRPCRDCHHANCGDGECECEKRSRQHAAALCHQPRLCGDCLPVDCGDGECECEKRRRRNAAVFGRLQRLQRHCRRSD